MNARITNLDTRKMNSFLRDSRNWYADGTFNAISNQFFQLYTIYCENMVMKYPFYMNF